MSKFQVGDKVVRTKHFFNTFEEGVPYTVDDVDDDEDTIQLKEFGDDWWNENNFKLYQEPAQKTFNPKPGDIIVTEGEGNWVCVDKVDKRFDAYPDYDFFGIQGSSFQGWTTDGSVYKDSELLSPCILHRYAVKEIIPASSNNPVAIPQENSDLSFQVKALELENQMLRVLLRREGVEV